jgi:hypothetical protein
MNRRGFFSKLFGTKKIPDVFFFGMQTVIGLYAKDNLRQELHKIISEGHEEESPREKKAYYKSISSVLLECLPSIEYGHWDYILKAADAEDEFHNWVNEIEASVATEEEEMGEEINEIQRMSNDKTYVAVTLVFLLEGSERLQQLMEIVEAISEDDLFSRASIEKIIEAINYIDFEYCYGDAAFIIPGNEEDGLSWEDIHSEGWDYLKPIM